MTAIAKDDVKTAEELLRAMVVKVYKMNDFDWVAACALDEAIRYYREDYLKGQLRIDAEYEGIGTSEARELTEEELDKTQFHDLDDYGRPLKRSFREELVRRCGKNERFPQFFASTEW